MSLIVNMKIDVQIISKETISPSSPTPATLHRYKLSFLDQIQPPVFMPLVMFYPKDDHISNEEQSQRIKGSLSQALTIFYPLAGRIKENSYVECRDQGLYFVQAKANCNLSDILDSRDPQDNKKFIPLELDEGADELPLIVQLTFFQCGGLAVLIGMSHKVGDALAYFMFTNCLAAIDRRSDNIKVITPPRFDSADLFPPKNISSFQPGNGIVKENIVMKRFVFSASAIATLREKYDVDGSRPTRLEALSALIFSRFMAATSTPQPNSSARDKSLQNNKKHVSAPAGSECDNNIPGEKLYTLFHIVNLRPRMKHSSLEESNNFIFGNISRPVHAQPWSTSGEIAPHEIVKRIKEAISKVDSDYVKAIQENDDYVHFLRNTVASIRKGERVNFAFTSLCRFPIYEVDFGWGKPVWVGSTRLPFKNLVTFFDTKSGDGIEAWINLEEEDMAKFETGEEFLSYVSSSR